VSRAWAGGSTTRWRKTRAMVLQRDSWICQLNLDGCTHRATQAHHTLGRLITGDDPAFLVAACRECNIKLGDPMKQPDPPPTPRTKW
jgi:hypothetical protein